MALTASASVTGIDRRRRKWLTLSQRGSDHIAPGAHKPRAHDPGDDRINIELASPCPYPCPCPTPPLLTTPLPFDEQLPYVLLHGGAYRLWPLPRTISSGSTPISTPRRTPGVANSLPPELWIEILSHLSSRDIQPLARISRTVSRAARHPSLHRYHELNMPLTPAALSAIRHARHVRISSTPEQDPRRLEAILAAIPPAQLLSLTLHLRVESWAAIGAELARLGSHLEVLRLPGAGLRGAAWVAHWGASIGLKGRGLRVVDLAGNPITAIPDWKGVQHLSLKNCALPPPALARVIVAMPHLRFLDLSGASQLDIPALAARRVIHTLPSGEVVPSPLREVRLLGDAVTRSDVRALQAAWKAQRQMCDGHAAWITPDNQDLEEPEMPGRGRPWPIRRVHEAGGAYYRISADWGSFPPPRPDGCLAIVHNARLDTDDEEGYRAYIAEIAQAYSGEEGTPTPALGHAFLSGLSGRIYEMWC